MNGEILNIGEKAAFDNSIIYGEYRTHQPFASSSYNNDDEIRIPIQQQDANTLPSESFLYIEGQVTVKKNGQRVAEPTVKFANNGILFLFGAIRIEIAGSLIEGVQNPGIASTMKGYATYNKNQSDALQVAGWFPKGNSTIIDSTTGYFNAIVPLKLALGFFEDFKKILVNMRQELILNRSSTDVNAFIDVDDDQIVSVDIHRIQWKVPHVSVSDVSRLRLMDIVSSGRELDIPFRSRELHEYPLLSQTQRHIWPIKTSVEKPQYIFFGFQTDRKNKLSKDCSKFDHCNLSNFKVFLNDEMYPYDNLNLNFNNNQYALLYEMYMRFQSSFLDKESEPLFTPEEFKTIAPIVIIDCTKQNESMKRSPVDIRLEFETRSNIPDRTTAYCVILHDRVVKYIPIQNVVRVI